MTRTILTSPADARSGLARELDKLGVHLLLWPKLSFDAPEDSFALDEAIDNLFGYDWLILKNEAAATYFLRRFGRSHKADAIDELKILAIGERTQQALSEAQIHVDVLVDRSAEVFGALKSYAGEISGLNLIIPSANLGRAGFELQLEDAGARVDAVLAYRSCANSDELVKLKALIKGGAIDFVAFTQAGRVDEFASLFDTDDLSQTLPGVSIACLDEATKEVANGYGLVNLLMPAEPSFAALARLILE